MTKIYTVTYEVEAGSEKEAISIIQAGKYPVLSGHVAIDCIPESIECEDEDE